MVSDFQEGDLAKRKGEGQGLRCGVPRHHAPRGIPRPRGIPLAVPLHAGDLGYNRPVEFRGIGD